MKKRSLADRLQAWQAEAEVPRATPAHQEEEEEADYMSDAFLADMEKTDAPRQLTYAEQRHKTLMEHAEHQRREMEEANERRSKRQRGPLAGEEEARQLGMATNVIERAAADHDQEAPSPGSGTSAALRMMLAMGYQPGTALGRTNMDAHHAPIAPDQRWLGHAGEAGPRRLGIGHAALSQRIADAAASAERVPVDPETQAMQYRVRKSQDAAQRHTEAMLRKARQICRELDEEAGIEVRCCSDAVQPPVARPCRASEGACAAPGHIFARERTGHRRRAAALDGCVGRGAHNVRNVPCGAYRCRGRGRDGDRCGVCARTCYAAPRGCRAVLRAACRGAVGCDARRVAARLCILYLLRAPLHGLPRAACRVSGRVRRGAWIAGYSTISNCTGHRATCWRTCCPGAPPCRRPPKSPFRWPPCGARGWQTYRPRSRRCAVRHPSCWDTTAQ